MVQRNRRQSKRKERNEQLFQSLERMAAAQDEDDERDSVPQPADGSEDTSGLRSIEGKLIEEVPDTSRLPRLKRFRFQLLHQWLVHHFTPCKAADVGGGKGLLSYLLSQSGWDVTVIDPFRQPLPVKYQDILTGKRLKIEAGRRVPQIETPFEVEQGAGYDLLIGMHAHGCNARIIDAAAAYGCGFIIFPCCIIGEPLRPPHGVHWLECLADYARLKGRRVQPFRLNFKGQNIGLFGESD